MEATKTNAEASISESSAEASISESSAEASMSESSAEASISESSAEASISESRAQAIGELTYCTVCFQTYNQPKILPCAHTFCHKCLAQLCKDRLITCPQCRRQHLLPRAGIDGFTDNLVLRDLVAILWPEHEIQGLEGRMKDDVLSRAQGSSMINVKADDLQPTFTQDCLPKKIDYSEKSFDTASDIVSKYKCFINSVINQEMMGEPTGFAHHAGRRELYVAVRTMVVLYRDGIRKRCFFKSEKHLEDVAVSSDGLHIYVATEHALVKLNIEGHVEARIEEFSKGYLSGCIAVACFNNHTYVVDYKYRSVIVFDENDIDIYCYGGREEMVFPCSVAVGQDGTIYVADDGLGCIHRIDRYGCPDKLVENLMDVWGVVVDGDGNVCVSRPASQSINVYNSAGKLVHTIRNETGRINGGRLHNLCFTPQGGIVHTLRYRSLLQIL